MLSFFVIYGQATSFHYVMSTKITLPLASQAYTKSFMIYKPDIVIFGSGIAGLWLFNHLKAAGYDALLLESEAIAGGQSIASQGIIHSGLKYAFAGKINKLAQSISAMPDLWRAALQGDGVVDLSAARLNARRRTRSDAVTPLSIA